MHPDDTLPCFQAHMGLWCIEPRWIAQAVQALRLGLFPMRSLEMRAVEMQRQQGKLYAQTDTGVAVIRVEGPITKPVPKFEGTSSVLTRRALRQATSAVLAGDLASILMKFDTPGGQVDGIQDLADEVQRARQQGVIVDAFLEDLTASAGYWIASQARRIAATATTFVGNIGAFAVLEDLSGLAEREGIRVVVKSTGPYKGLGVPGTPITQDLEDEVQRHVDHIGAFFFAAVRRGRRMNAAQLAAVTDGRLWIAADAQRLGLIDGVQTFDEAVTTALEKRPVRQVAARAELARLRAALTTGGS